MAYIVRSLTISDEAIVWQMLQHASHEPSIAAVKTQPCLVRYAIDWGRAGDRGCVAQVNQTAIGAAWLRLWRDEERGFGYINADTPELSCQASELHMGFPEALAVKSLQRLCQRSLND